MSPGLPERIEEQMRNAGLPFAGQHSFKPKIVKNRRNEDIIDKQVITKGPKRGKKGYVDDQERIWIKDWTHAGLPDHWDVQINGGDDYFRVDKDGNEVS